VGWGGPPVGNGRLEAILPAVIGVSVLSLGDQSALGRSEHERHAIPLVLDDLPAERTPLVPESIIGDGHGLSDQTEDRCPLLWCQGFEVAHLLRDHLHVDRLV